MGKEVSFGWVDSYPIQHPQKRAFLHAYAEGSTIAKACDLAGVHRLTHYDWLKNDGPELAAYRAAFADARERRFEVLEQEARRRAVDGVESTYVGKDGQVYNEIKYSDTLLIFLMKGEHPEKYRDNYQAQINVQNNFDHFRDMMRLPEVHTKIYEGEVIRDADTGPASANAPRTDDLPPPSTNPPTDGGSQAGGDSSLTSGKP